jgi:thiol-disulfide isomerase/thioredoxin
MKRLLLAAILLLACAPSVPASHESELKPFERGSWQQLLHSHAGHPTLVHFWGVTCGPCKVELPQLGEFMKHHPAVDVVTISADLVPNLGPATRSMLQNAGLSSADNWIFSDGFVERLRFEIDPAWQGDIPRTMLISRNGEIITIEGSATAAALEKWSDEQNSSGQMNPTQTEERREQS